MDFLVFVLVVAGIGALLYFKVPKVKAAVDKVVKKAEDKIDG